MALNPNKRKIAKSKNMSLKQQFLAGIEISLKTLRNVVVIQIL